MRIIVWSLPFTKNLIWEICWLAFCQHQKHQKSQLAKIHQNLKKSNLGIPMLWCWCLLKLFRPPVSISFPEHLNLLNCNTYNAKTYHFRRPSLALKINEKCFVSNPLLGPHFSYFILIFSKNDRFGDPFKIQRAPKLDQNRPSGEILVKSIITQRFRYSCQKIHDL